MLLVLIRLRSNHLNLGLVNVQRLLLHGRLPLVEARIFNLNLLLVLSAASIASYINLNYLLKKALLTILSVHVWLTRIHRATVKCLGIILILLILSAVHQFHRLLVVLLTLLLQKLGRSHHLLRHSLVRYEPVILSRKVLRLVFHTLNNYEYSN
jgi:hypothetical protein